jgi:hypothetical protein
MEPPDTQVINKWNVQVYSLVIGDNI